MTNNYKHSDITRKILNAFYAVYNELGYGFLEKVYDNTIVGDYFADIVVEDKVILELKAVENICPEHEVQLVNYLKATEIEVGLLLNFGPKPQQKRRVLTKEYLNKLDAD